MGEPVLDRLLSRVPYYCHAKVAFLLWLQWRHGGGSDRLYSARTRPSPPRLALPEMNP